MKPDLETVKVNHSRELVDRYTTVVDSLSRLVFLGPLDEVDGLELTGTQIRILTLLEHFGSLRMSSISQYVGVSRSAATGIVDRLVQSNLVKRDTDLDDRRVVNCKLTASGQKTTRGFRDYVTKRAVSLSHGWDAGQFEAVVQTLELVWRTDETITGAEDSKKQVG